MIGTRLEIMNCRACIWRFVRCKLSGTMRSAICQNTEGTARGRGNGNIIDTKSEMRGKPYRWMREKVLVKAYLIFESSCLPGFYLFDKN